VNAVEFQATVHNGVITLPRDQKSWDGKKIKVILLEINTNTAPDLLVDNLESETDFFECAGIWKNHDISQQSIRDKAWPDQHE
jgi:hypothetical protein